MLNPHSIKFESKERRIKNINHNTGELDDEGVRRQLDTLNKMKNLLSDEEKEAFGKYMDAEEERKNKLYA